MYTSENTISWQEYEYVHHEKSSDWFWALGIIALSSAVTAIIFKNILFALLILIGAFAVALLAAKRPSLVHFEITRRGVSIDDVLYPFSTLKTFWINENEDEYGRLTLILESKRVMMPYIIIPIHSEVDISEIEKIKDILLNKLDEKELREPISHKILELFGF